MSVRAAPAGTRPPRPGRSTGASGACSTWCGGRSPGGRDGHGDHGLGRDHVGPYPYPDLVRDLSLCRDLCLCLFHDPSRYLDVDVCVAPRVLCLRRLALDDDGVDACDGVARDPALICRAQPFRRRASARRPRPSMALWT